ncbi:hypothetical protein [Piscicoccus intestinalis]|uniref:hypothetical protein n=1 Tax=Piscicoccus intestinalis TaxID=746033 RepID=UPI000837B7A7|nr:hypothetical protein [Piscicoccus intestinalis]
MTDPVPPAARRELERLARRWQQLPLDRALQCVPAVREVAQRFADTGPHPGELPDLGPAVLLDQLTVTAYDLAASGKADILEPELTRLRRDVG